MKSLTNILNKSIILYSVVLVLLFFVLTHFITPSSDDFRGFSLDKHTYGFVDSFNKSKDYYLHWEGRYTHYFLIYFVPSLYYMVGITNDQTIVKIQAFLTLFFFLFSIMLVFRLTTVKKDPLVLALMTSCLLLTFSSIAEYIYWFTGSLGYAWGSIALYCCIYIYERKIAPNSSLNGYFWLSLLLIFFGGGIHFFFPIFFVLYYFTNQVFFYAKHKQLNKTLLYLLLFSLLDFTLTAVSPGNYIRREIIAKSMTHSHFQWDHLNITLEWIRNMWFNPYGWKTFLLALLGALIIIKNNKTNLNKEFLHRFFTFIFISSLVIQLFFNLAFSSHKSVWTVGREFGFFTQISLFFFFCIYLILTKIVLEKSLFLTQTLNKLYPMIVVGLLMLSLHLPSFKTLLNSIQNGSDIEKRYERISSYLLSEKEKNTPKTQLKINCYQEDNITVSKDGLILIPFTQRLFQNHYSYENLLPIIPKCP